MRREYWIQPALSPLSKGEKHGAEGAIVSVYNI